jgi:hypothetical protein
VAGERATDCEAHIHCAALKLGYAIDFGQWCGSKDERDFANFADEM